ncbi:hypothetical protein Aperf_G00000038115 [Anoplocephala perfoliata]
MEYWGETSKGDRVERVTIRPKLSSKLTNGPDGEAWSKVEAVILNYGATIQQLWIPGYTDSRGDKRTFLWVADVILGYPDVKDYEKSRTYQGAIVGRVAGRIKNAEFTIPTELDSSNSKIYKLPRNQQDKHCLHGGITGLSFRNWDIIDLKEDSVKLKVVSADGEEGFPGKMTVCVTYHISVDEEEQRVLFSIDYDATISDGICPINLTNHAYFNLAGHRAGPKALDRHSVCIKADKMCEFDADLLPTGSVIKAGQVDGTDLTQMTCLKEGLRKIHPEPQTGYDDFYIFNDLPEDEAKVVVIEPISCRRLEVFTDQLGMQFYTANGFNPNSDPKGKDYYRYPPHSGLCLEVQGYPDAVNQPNFPKQFLTPTGKNYVQKTLFVFSIQKNCHEAK